jgi:hypothetical protein
VHVAASSLLLPPQVLYPITPPWESPPRPSKTLAELVPRATPPPRPRESAAQTFQKAVQQAATHLAQLLQRAAGSVEAACKLSRQDMSALLNQSGTYLQLREQLKAAVMALARERCAAQNHAPSVSCRMQLEMPGQCVHNTTACPQCRQWL